MGKPCLLTKGDEVEILLDCDEKSVQYSYKNEIYWKFKIQSMNGTKLYPFVHLHYEPNWVRIKNMS